MAVLVPCLDALRDEFDKLNQTRDKSSDGWIGDAAHADHESDHNPDESGATHDEDSDNTDEVHAIDVDKTGSWPNGMDMSLATDLIVRRHRDGVDNRLQRVIYNRRTAADETGWKWVDYNGDNAHTEHAHFSARYDTGKLENDRSSWGLVEKWGDDVTKSEFMAWSKEWWASTDGQQALTSWAKSTNGKNALLAAGGKADVVPRYADGVAVDDPANPYTGVDTSLGSINKNQQQFVKDLAAQDAKLDQILAALPATTAAATPAAKPRSTR
jgi:hypothetical protein